MFEFLVTASTEIVGEAPLAHSYGVCERQTDLWYAEPFNVLSNLGFFIVAYLLVKYYRTHPDLRGKWIWDLHVLTLLTIMIGFGSMMFHSMPSPMTERLDIFPIIAFIILFFISIIVRIGRTNVFQTIICFLAFAGSTHFFVTQFPNALNDSIGYLSSMAALVMIAIYLHLKRRPSSQRFLLAALIGCLSLFFRAVDNAVCEVIPFGTHFLWHSLNAVLIYLVMMQLIRNVNREARLARVHRAGVLQR